MSNVGPVCHIPPNTTAGEPPPQPLPAIPPAQPNIASLTATVNAMRAAFMIFTGQRGPAGTQGRNGKDAPSGSWKQVEVDTEVVRIFNPNDNTQFIDVQRINKLVFNNQASKQTITFTRPPTPAGQ